MYWVVVQINSFHSRCINCGVFMDQTVHSVNKGKGTDYIECLKLSYTYLVIQSQYFILSMFLYVNFLFLTFIFYVFSQC